MGRKRNTSARTRRGLKKFGFKISYLRKCKDMSQEELAEATGYSLSHLAKIEANVGSVVYKPSIDFIFDVAEALGVPVSELFEDEPPQKTTKKKKGR